MHRPDHSTADPDGIDTGVAGYTEGNAIAAPPVARTIVTADHINDLGESACRFVEHAGITLVKGDYDQLVEAIERKRMWDAVCDVRRAAAEPYGAGTFNCGFANGWFFASNNSGAMSKSRTGEVWETAGTVGSTFPAGWAYGAGVYVNVGGATGGPVHYDADAVGAWTAAGTPPVANQNAVAWNGSVFCSVGATGSIYTSPDGNVWTARTAGSGYAGQFRAVIWHDTLSLFIACGQDVIQTSPTGTTWTQQHIDAARDYYSLAVSESGRIVAGDGVTPRYSDNAVTWTAATTTGSMEKIAGYNGGFLAIGDDGVMRASRDGDTFVQFDTFGTTLSSVHIASGDDKVIVRANEGSGVTLFWRRASPTPGF